MTSIDKSIRIDAKFEVIWEKYAKLFILMKNQ